MLAPTRELATQITAAIEPLATALGLRSPRSSAASRRPARSPRCGAGVDIVVACPGRLEDLMRQRALRLDAVEITVIDEADHMADLGFLPGVTRILTATPAGGQRMLFSATLDNGVDKLVKRFLRNQVAHSVDEANSPVAAMTHHVFHVTGVDAKRKLVHQLASGTGRRILFMRTKHQARKLAKQLTDAGVPSVDLHGNLSQPARDRNLAAFSSGEAACWWPPTSPRAASTSTTWNSSCTSIRPPSTRRTCTARAAPRAPAAPATWSPWCCPSSAGTPPRCCGKAGINVKPQDVGADSAPVQALVGEVAPYQAPQVKAQPRPQAKPPTPMRSTTAAQAAPVAAAGVVAAGVGTEAVRPRRRPARSRDWPACPVPTRRGGGPRSGLRVRGGPRWRR